jgi:hypothetical protein
MELFSIWTDTKSPCIYNIAIVLQTTIFIRIGEKENPLSHFPQAFDKIIQLVINSGQGSLPFFTALGIKMNNF